MPHFRSISLTLRVVVRVILRISYQLTNLVIRDYNCYVKLFHIYFVSFFPSFQLNAEVSPSSSAVRTVHGVCLCVAFTIVANEDRVDFWKKSKNRSDTILNRRTQHALRKCNHFSFNHHLKISVHSLYLYLFILLYYKETYFSSENTQR